MLRLETVSKDEVVLVVRGPLSGDAVNEFHEKMEELCAGRFTTVVLDLSQTPSINSTALGKILLYRRRLAEKGATLQISGCSEGLYKVFQAIKLERLIKITK